MYSYYGKSANSEYAQYNNGLESFTYENSKVSHMSKGDADFVRYTRKLPHPQADAGLLIYSPENITEAKEETVDGGIKVTHVYDAEKIGAQVEEGSVKGFRAEYMFDNDGKLKYFDEITDAENNGSAVTYDYRVEITQQNSVDTVENTVKRFIEE
ncbi:conserved domain protein [Ruminococcus albus 8]|uniref:Conserved domain protein n=1 Tax=Ruminococcus albus 8 TaxID=246199 RepID=E9S8S2_RUMAL|nr:conserved domain protein [Ruminococcus albus 8]